MGFNARYGASTPSFQPPDILGLALWLDAADTSTITQVSGAVSQWNDKSGNALHFAQATAAQQPALGATTITGLNLITFDGSNDRMQLTSALNGLANANNTIFIAARSTNLTTSQYLFSTGNSNPPGYGVSVASDSFVLRHGGTVTKNITRDESLHIFGFSRSSAGLNPFLDGAALTGGNVATDNLITLARIGGSSGGNSAYLTGAIAEIIVYNTALSTSDINLVGHYLGHKWGVAWTGL